MSRIVKFQEERNVVSRAADFGRVAVMLGGTSAEREVSLNTGNAVLEALLSLGVDAHPWDPAAGSMSEFSTAGFDRVWIALHGTGGEDGSLQGALQWLDTPYTGSGVLASALAMDKIRSKHLFEATGIPTPDYAVVRHAADAVLAAEELGFPMVLKPAAQGSSVGIAKVFDGDDLQKAVRHALQYGGAALAERCIVGQEFTVAILQGQALPSIRIETPRVFYDYRAKYESDRTEYHCPGSGDDEAEAKFANLAQAAFSELGCSGWGRVDFMVGDDGEPQVLEINTIPGMTSHSLVPMAAKQAGIEFDELCWRILETSVGESAAHSAIEVAANDA